MADNRGEDRPPDWASSASTEGCQAMVDLRTWAVSACRWALAVSGLLLLGGPAPAQQTLPEVGVEAPRPRQGGAGLPSGGVGVPGNLFPGTPQPAPAGPQQPPEAPRP